MEFLHGLLRDFGIVYEYYRFLIIGIVVAWVVILVLRIMLTSGYVSQLQLAKASAAKGIPDAESIAKLRPPLLKRAAVDYAFLGERGIARIDSRDLVRKSARKLKFLWWSFESCGRFLDTMEPAVFFAGIIFTIISEQRAVFAAVTLILFAIGKLLSTFIDYKKTRDELFDEVAFLLDKELGRLYVTDGPAAINNLRGELKGLMNYQAKYLSDTITELRDKLAAVTEKSTMTLLFLSTFTWSL